VPALETLLDGLVDSPGRVVVDLTDTAFIDSSVAKVFLACAKHAPGRVSAVTAPGTPPGRVFELLALSDVLPTYPSVAVAIDRLKRAG
jgi:anti-anti-sigma regulatory factor